MSSDSAGVPPPTSPSPNTSNSMSQSMDNRVQPKKQFHSQKKAPQKQPKKHTESHHPLVANPAKGKESTKKPEEKKGAQEELLEEKENTPHPSPMALHAHQNRKSNPSLETLSTSHKEPSKATHSIFDLAQSSQTKAPVKKEEDLKKRQNNQSSQGQVNPQNISPISMMNSIDTQGIAQDSSGKIEKSAAVTDLINHCIDKILVSIPKDSGEITTQATLKDGSLITIQQDASQALSITIKTDNELFNQQLAGRVQAALNERIVNGKKINVKDMKIEKDFTRQYKTVEPPREGKGNAFS